MADRIISKSVNCGSFSVAGTIFIIKLYSKSLGMIGFGPYKRASCANPGKVS